jgi:hypothetical protein
VRKGNMLERDWRRETYCFLKISTQGSEMAGRRENTHLEEFL